MNVKVQLCGKEQKYIINNLYPLYLHDLAGIRSVLPNKYGVFEDSDAYRTLQQQIMAFDIWWEKEDCLFPFLVWVDEVPAGFALIAAPPYVDDDSDFLVNEFFILRPFRGRGVAEEAITTIFNRLKGKWLLYTFPTDNNLRTIKFWRKTLGRYTSDLFTEEDKALRPEMGVEKVFNFSNLSS
ncbi:GNAT family N-acetyltransferase [Paenibacillus glycinis]|uniref:GNAT family N-acetyltransferase n=1 Tax=Paenibacillus glycinis TaxID=2697035 RepID=A0ABW9XZS3_9BACL|nr:GNAT family N-acetyltransferase [Paenibacillus glycinis]NBD27702.1 GNAT family N-acetyltransferase [Paenibacillus glycinis]